MSENKISQEQQSDLYCAVVFAKVAQDYSEMILRSTGVKREAKVTFTQFIAAVNRFVSSLRAAITTEEGKRAFDAEWQKDYLSYASIFHSLVQMNPQQIEGTERFCQGVLLGEVEVVLSKESDEYLVLRDK